MAGCTKCEFPSDLALTVKEVNDRLKLVEDRIRKKLVAVRKMEVAQGNPVKGWGQALLDRADGSQSSAIQTVESTTSKKCCRWWFCSCEIPASCKGTSAAAQSEHVVLAAIFETAKACVSDQE